MNFVLPLMLLGVLGVAVPLWLHWKSKTKVPRVPFGALEFLWAVSKEKPSRVRLRQKTLLVSRILLCLLVAAILAKPYATCQSKGSGIPTGAQAAVLIVDDSQVSSATFNGSQVSDLLKKKAEQVLREVGPLADMAVVAGSQGGKFPTELSRDHIRLRDYIRVMSPSPRPQDLSSAMAHAATLLSRASRVEKHVYVMSTLSSVGEDWAPTLDATVHWFDPTDGAQLSNLAVTALEFASASDVSPLGFRAVASCTNFSAKPVVGATLRMWIGGTLVASALIDIAPGTTQSKTFTAELPHDRSVAEVIVEIEDREIPLDNRRYGLVRNEEAFSMLLVNGDPNTLWQKDELTYIQAALRPGDMESGIRYKSITAPDISTETLNQVDVVLLANPGSLQATAIAQLTAWVNEGGGLFITMGDNVQPSVANQELAALLPQRVAIISAAVANQFGGETQSSFVRLADIDVAHPATRVFAGNLTVLTEAAFAKFALLEPAALKDSEELRVWARFDNGAIALVERAVGKGRVLLYTSSIDQDWNDLPLQPGFVPLMQQIAKYLAKRQTNRRTDSVLVGATYSLPLTGRETRVELVGPDNRVLEAMNAAELAGKKNLSFDKTATPGFYKIILRNADDKVEEREFVVNLDPRASDVRVVRKDLANIGRPSEKNSRGEPVLVTHSVELWHALAFALLALFCIEGILANISGRRPLA